MRRIGRSLYARIVVRLFLVLGLAGSVLLAAAWYYARFAIDQAYDEALLGGAIQIAENTSLRNGSVDVEVPVSAFYVLSRRDQVFYKVIDPAGRVIAGDPDLQVDVPAAELHRGPVLTSATHRGEVIRVALVARQMFDTEARGWATIVLAETEGSRNSQATNLTLKVFLIIMLMGVITIAGAMLATRDALRPLAKVAEAIRARDPNSPTLLDVEAPAEAEALVDSINDFIKRLNARISLMRRVIGDVAHQIRTPITAAVSQVEMLELQQTEEGRHRQIARVKERLSDIGALVQQLISHAMVLHRSEARSFEDVDIATLLRREMTDMLSEESPRDIEVSFDAPAEPLVVFGDPVTLREAVRNVLNNALRHGAPSRLSVTVARQASFAVVSVLDDGPGIPVDRWDLVRQPFSPRADARGGASLGLAIVNEVIKAHDGELQFSIKDTGEFVVELSIPLKSSTQEAGERLDRLPRERDGSESVERSELT